MENLFARHSLRCTQVDLEMRRSSSVCETGVDIMGGEQVLRIDEVFGFYHFRENYLKGEAVCWPVTLIGFKFCFRWAPKYVILDCPAPLAQDVIIKHVQDVHMGRKTYHYLLSGLVSFPRVLTFTKS